MFELSGCFLTKLFVLMSGMAVSSPDIISSLFLTVFQTTLLYSNPFPMLYQSAISQYLAKEIRKSRRSIFRVFMHNYSIPQIDFNNISFFAIDLSFNNRQAHIDRIPEKYPCKRLKSSGFPFRYPPFWSRLLSIASSKAFSVCIYL